MKIHFKFIVLVAFTFIGSCRSNDRSASNTVLDLKGGKIKTDIQTDVLVYGASASGVLAAAAAAREGFSVVLVEPTYTIGGLLASGFRMQQDVPDPQHLGGLTRDYYDK